MTEQQPTPKKVSFDEVQELGRRFIDLANAMKNEGRTPDAVNGALMFASCVYATYSAAGNDGYLQPAGVEKVAAVYRNNLAELQRRKKLHQERQET